MGFVAPDLVVESRLRATLKLIRQDPTILDDAMERFSASGRKEIRDFLLQRDIPVLQGWPVQNAQVPCIAVALRPAMEQTQRQSLTPFDSYATEEGNLTTIAAFTGSTVQCLCYGHSQREATIVGMVTWWMLWVLRMEFQQQRMVEQSITVSDYEQVPSNDEGGGLWFLRAVNLTCTTIDTLSLVEGPVIAAVTLALQGTGDVV